MNRLKELRLSAGITQLELAKAAETTQRNISYWENGHGEINLISAIRLAQIFQVDVEYLAGYSDDFDIKPELNAAPMGESATTSEEVRLIKVFRTLSPDLKNTLWSLLDTWTPTETLIPPKKKQT